MPGTLNVKTLRLAPLGHSRKRADQMGDNWGRDESGKRAEKVTGCCMFWLDRSLCSESGLQRVSSRFY